MKPLSRRQFLGSTVATLVISPTLLLTSRTATATDMPKLDPADAQAKALSYVHQSPKDDNLCSNCRLYTGSAEAEWGPCAIFPGKQVASAGWCSAWVKRGA